MRSDNEVIRLVVVLTITALAAPRAAHAYIDPLTGSILLQALIAGFLAFLATSKRFVARVKRIARHLAGRGAQD